MNAGILNRWLMGTAFFRPKHFVCRKKNDNR